MQGSSRGITYPCNCFQVAAGILCQRRRCAFCPPAGRGPPPTGRRLRVGRRGGGRRAVDSESDAAAAAAGQGPPGLGLRVGTPPGRVCHRDGRRQNSVFRVTVREAA